MANDETTRREGATSSSVKRPYEPPVVEILGSLSELTGGPGDKEWEGGFRFTGTGSLF